MQAVVKTQKGAGHVELMDMPEPRARAGEVVIEVEFCGICGTDIHILHDEFPYWPPVILGHEFSGRIVDAGAETGLFKTGQRVVCEPHTESCGHCYLCRAGDIHLCPMKRAPGWGIHGAFARYVRVPERLLHAIPDHMSFEQAAMVEPAANAVHDVIERARMKAGDFVVVLGPGPIGTLSAMAAKAGGARTVVLAGTPGDAEVRLARGRELGFETVNVAETDLVQYVKDHTGGVGADMVVEASGSPKAAAMAPDLLKRKGKICAIGMTGGNRTVEFPWDRAVFKACEILFCLSTHYSSWDRTIHLIASGIMPAEKSITHTMPIQEWRRAFDECEAQRAIKVLLHP